MTSGQFSDHMRLHFPEVVKKSVLVALSGGADSVSLVHLLSDCDLQIKLFVAYIDHHQRPHEVEHEISFCRQLCWHLGAEFTVLGLAPCDSPSEGREADWRRRRYTALLDHARGLDIEFVATGHHRDDVAEGVLLQLLRGAGPRALAGIAARTPDGVIRPLLPYSKVDLKVWLDEHGHTWCEDSSNQSSAHLRNRVRHEVLPFLETHSPQLRRHLVALAGALADGEQALAEDLTRRATWIDPFSPAGGVAVNTVADLPRALRQRWLQSQCERQGLARATRRQIELFNALLEGQDPATLVLGGRWRLRRVQRTLWLEPPTLLEADERTLPFTGEIALSVPGWWVRVVTAAQDDEKQPQTPITGWRWQAPRNAVLTIRGARPGDVVGDGSHRRSVRSLLTASLPRHLRRAWPLFTVGDTIKWIPGVWQGPSEAQRHLEVEVFRR